jgi:hypothetical protein
VEIEEEADILELQSNSNNQLYHYAAEHFNDHSGQNDPESRTIAAASIASANLPTHKQSSHVLIQSLRLEVNCES